MRCAVSPRRRHRWGDVMAINARSELMYSHRGRSAAAALSGECTSFAVLPRHPPTPTLVVRTGTAAVRTRHRSRSRIHRNDLPANHHRGSRPFLQGRFNAAGSRVHNTLITRDQGADGVPTTGAALTHGCDDDLRRIAHDLCRAACVSATIVAHSDGQAVNVETTPAMLRVHVSLRKTDTWCTAIIFSRPFAPLDARVAQYRMHLSRGTMRRGLDAAGGAVASRWRSHAQGPSQFARTVCSHRTAQESAGERTTVISVVRFGSRRTLDDTRPCESEYRVSILSPSRQLR